MSNTFKEYRQQYIDDNISKQKDAFKERVVELTKKLACEHPYADEFYIKTEVGDDRVFVDGNDDVYVHISASDFNLITPNIAAQAVYELNCEDQWFSGCSVDCSKYSSYIRVAVQDDE